MLELDKTYQTSENRYVTMVSEKKFFVDQHGEFWSEEGDFSNLIQAGGEKINLNQEPITTANAREIIKNLQETISSRVFIDIAEVQEYLDTFLDLTEPSLKKDQLVLENFKRYKTFGGHTVRVEQSENDPGKFFGYLPSSPHEFIWSSHGIYLEELSQHKISKNLPWDYYDLVSEA